jgi:hypothetical protein
MNPTTDEIVQAAVASAGSETVKTVTDLRLEKLEARLDELLKVNAELRAANKELYALASTATAAEPATASASAPSSPVAAATVGQPDAAQIAAQQKAREDQLLAGVMAEMGYKPKTETPTVSNNNTMDGM